jgi:hypothetical protein
MIGMDSQGHDMDLMARCTPPLPGFADVCSLSAQWMSRLSPVSEEICRFFARVCEECAELCKRQAPHHTLCGTCAEECRRCASMCRGMAELSIPRDVAKTDPELRFSLARKN